MHTMQQWPSRSQQSAHSYSKRHQSVPLVPDEKQRRWRKRYTPEHRSNALAVPAVALRVGAGVQAGEVGRVVVARSVARHGDPLRRALVRDELREGALGALLDLQWGLGEGHSEAGLQVPFDVACLRRCQECEEMRTAFLKRVGGGDVQWKSQTPGLSAMTRRVTECIEGTWTVSRRMGFFWPSMIGGLRAGSVDV